MGGAGRGDQEAGGDTGAAAGVPGTGVVATRQAGDARGAVFEDFVVRFEVLHELPGLVKAGRPQGEGDGRQVHGRARPAAGLGEGVAQGGAQRVVVAGIEAGAAIGGGLHDVGVDVPVFGVLQAAGAEGVAGIVEVLEARPAVGLVGVHHDAHLVVAQAIGMIFREQELGVVDEELADLLSSEGEAESTGVADVAEVKAVVVVALGHAVEEVEALVVEIAAGMVINHVENDRQAVQMGEVHQAAKLVRGAIEMRGGQWGLALGGEQVVDAGQTGGDFRRGAFIVVFRREVIRAIVTEAERSLKLDDRKQLEGGDAEVAQVGQSRDDIEELARLLAA